MIDVKPFLTRLILLLLASCLAYGSHVNAQDTKNSTRWIMDVTPTKSQLAVDFKRARIVVFRLAHDQEAFASTPLNIFINNTYHASLLPEHQAAVIPLCPGKKLISVASGKSGPMSNKVKNVAEKEETPTLQAGNIYFYQVAMDNQGKIVTRWVEYNQAKEVLEHINIQTHTISRLVNETSCIADNAFSNKIDSLALFNLAQYDQEGMIPESAWQVRQFAKKILADYETINKVEVKGYADPTGSFDYNQLISEHRAVTVASLLLAEGMPENIISTQGMGASQLFVADCNKYNLSKEDVIGCNQPNRRVEVEVYGIKRTNEG